MVDTTHVVVPRARLGDTLLTLVVAHNLARTGHAVAVLAPHLAELRAWFPGLRIVDSWDSDGLAAAPIVVHQSAATLASVPEGRTRENYVLGDTSWLDRREPRIDGYVEICRRRFGIESPTRANGLERPASVEDATARGRVLVHPGAGEPHKTWPGHKFLALSDELARHGHAPLWIAPPGERDALVLLAGGRFEVLARERQDDLAALLAEATLFIGNDSGVSHLASNTGTPTVTLFARPRIARHWSPAWAPGEVVLPRLRLPGASLQRLTWQHFLPVRDVVRACKGYLSR